MDLFDTKDLLRDLPKAPPPFVLRSLRSADFSLGYVQLLSQLSKTGNYTEAVFADRFRLMQKCNRISTMYVILVVEDTVRQCIVGCASLVVEAKFLRSASFAGHVEDVVTDKSVRGLGVGKLLIDSLIILAGKLGCYKVLLDCSEDNVPFYERCGMKKKEVQMVRYLDEGQPKAKL